MIATKYAKNATGAVTGVSRTCFSLGQATGPLVSGLIWNWSVSGPYMLLAAVQLSQIVCMLVTRTPLWRDPIENKDTSFQKAMTRTAMPRSLGSVLNLTLTGKEADHDASGRSSTSGTSGDSSSGDNSASNSPVKRVSFVAAAKILANGQEEAGDAYPVELDIEAKGEEEAASSASGP